MIELQKKLSAAAYYIVVLLFCGAGTYCASKTRNVHSEGERNLERLEQFSSLEKQLTATKAALADREYRLKGCRATINRYQTELQYVDAQLAQAKGER